MRSKSSIVSIYEDSKYAAPHLHFRLHTYGWLWILISSVGLGLDFELGLGWIRIAYSFGILIEMWGLAMCFAF
jgi:hypothetical protein